MIKKEIYGETKVKKIFARNLKVECSRACIRIDLINGFEELICPKEKLNECLSPCREIILFRNNNRYTLISHPEDNLPELRGANFSHIECVILPEEIDEVSLLYIIFLYKYLFPARHHMSTNDFILSLKHNPLLYAILCDLYCAWKEKLNIVDLIELLGFEKISYNQIAKYFRISDVKTYTARYKRLLSEGIREKRSIFTGVIKQKIENKNNENKKMRERNKIWNEKQYQEELDCVFKEIVEVIKHKGNKKQLDNFFYLIIKSVDNVKILKDFLNKKPWENN